MYANHLINSTNLCIKKRKILCKCILRSAILYRAPIWSHRLQIDIVKNELRDIMNNESKL